MYVNTILEVHKKYNALVLTAFNNDSGFVAALDKACGRFINSNSVTRYARRGGYYFVYVLLLSLFFISLRMSLSLCYFQAG